MKHSKMDHSTGLAAKRPTNWLLLCVGVVVAIAVAVKIFGLPLTNVIYFGALIACPLMHIWMMKNGAHKH